MTTRTHIPTSIDFRAGRKSTFASFGLLAGAAVLAGCGTSTNQGGGTPTNQGGGTPTNQGGAAPENVQVTTSGYDVSGSENVDILRLPGSRSDYARIDIDGEGNIFIERTEITSPSPSAARKRIFQANQHDGEEDGTLDPPMSEEARLDGILQGAQAADMIIDVADVNEGDIISLADIEAVQFANDGGDVEETLFTPLGLEEAEINGATDHDDILVGTAPDDDPETDQNDTIRGQDGDDVLSGFDGDDMLYGDGGSDVIHGGRGSDTIHGGGGSANWLYGESLADSTSDSDDIDTVVFSGDIDDWIFLPWVDLAGYSLEEDSPDTLVSGFIVDNGESHINENETNYVLGFERIQFGEDENPMIFQIIQNGEGTEDAEFLLGDVSENVMYDGIGRWYSDTDDQINGNAGDDYIWGLDGDDTLNGGSGDDLIHGGRGDDIIDGGENVDTVFYENELFHSNQSHGVTGDLENGNLTITVIARDSSEIVPEGMDTLTNVERIQFGFYDVKMFGVVAGTDTGDSDLGSGENDLILGLGGVDTINGGEGDDIIDGGEGNDIITGGEGNDIIDGGDGDEDMAVFAGALEDHQLSMSRYYSGGEFYDVLFVTDDEIIGEEENDRPIREIDQLINVEYFRFDSGGQVGSRQNISDYFASERMGVRKIEGGSGNDIIAGDDYHQSIIGGSGNDMIMGHGDHDIIHGHEGNDVIHGGEGGDEIFGGVGDDRLTGGTGNDKINGGEDEDTVIYDGTIDDYAIWQVGENTYVLHKSEEDTASGLDTLTNVEMLNFNSVDVTLEDAVDHDTEEGIIAVSEIPNLRLESGEAIDGIDVSEWFSGGGELVYDVVAIEEDHFVDEGPRIREIDIGRHGLRFDDNTNTIEGMIDNTDAFDLFITIEVTASWEGERGEESTYDDVAVRFSIEVTPEGPSEPGQTRAAPRKDEIVGFTVGDDLSDSAEGNSGLPAEADVDDCCCCDELGRDEAVGGWKLDADDPCGCFM